VIAELLGTLAVSAPAADDAACLVTRPTRPITGRLGRLGATKLSYVVRVVAS
jgi:hypothetical protein